MASYKTKKNRQQSVPRRSHEQNVTAVTSPLPTAVTAGSGAAEGAGAGVWWGSEGDGSG